jgi:hypothetical protein
MPSVTLSLNHFNQPVPTSEAIVDRASLLAEVSKHPAGPIVIVDRWGCPLGTLDSQWLITYFLYQQRKTNLETPADRLIDLSALARPVMALPARMSVHEFLETLTGEPSVFDLVLVDNRGKLIGRLDTGRLLQFSLGRVLLEDQEAIGHPDRSIADSCPSLPGRGRNFLSQSSLVRCDRGILSFSADGSDRVSPALGDPPG